MKLWIRSQNKEALANVKNVRFCKMKKCELKETSCTIKEFVESADAYCVECNGEFFGEYATRERCLEIIDEIQKLLEASDPTKAFLNIECDVPLDYIEAKEIIKMARTERVGYVPNGKVELIMPNVITYQMPEN